MLDGLAAAAPELKVTVDPVENRGFEYHTGISFTFFARLCRDLGPVGELGRGGRYDAGDLAAPEPATGFTLYTDTILRTLPKTAAPRRLLLPFGADRARGRSAARSRLGHGRRARAAVATVGPKRGASDAAMCCENGEPVALE